MEAASLFRNLIVFLTYWFMMDIKSVHVKAMNWASQYFFNPWEHIRIMAPFSFLNPFFYICMCTFTSLCTLFFLVSETWPCSFLTSFKYCSNRSFLMVNSCLFMWNIFFCLFWKYFWSYHFCYAAIESFS